MNYQIFFLLIILLLFCYQIIGTTVYQEQDKCPICLDSLYNNEAVVKLPCGHRFHEHCIKGVYQTCTNRVCPLGRCELPDDINECVAEILEESLHVTENNQEESLQVTENNQEESHETFASVIRRDNPNIIRDWILNCLEHYDPPIVQEPNRLNEFTKLAFDAVQEIKSKNNYNKRLNILCRDLNHNANISQQAIHFAYSLDKLESLYWPNLQQKPSVYQALNLKHFSYQIYKLMRYRDISLEKNSNDSEWISFLFLNEEQSNNPFQSKDLKAAIDPWRNYDHPNYQSYYNKWCTQWGKEYNRFLGHYLDCDDT